MEVIVHNEQQDFPILDDAVARLVKEVLFLEEEQADLVYVHLVTKQEISELHAEHYDDPSPTDCLAFVIDERGAPPPRVLGELFVCPQVAKEYVDQNGGNPYEELSLYLVHALLHLVGYDDVDDAVEQKMRLAEQRHLDHLAAHNMVLSNPSLL